MDAEGSLGLSDYLATVRRRRRLMLSLAVPIFLIVTIVALALPSVYASFAVFRLRDTGNDQNRQRYVDKYVSNLKDNVMDLRRREGIDKGGPIDQKFDGSKVLVEMMKSSVLDPDSGRNREILTGFSVGYESEDPQTAATVAKWISNAFVTVGREDALAQVASQNKFFSDEADRTRQKIAEFEAKLADFKRINFEQLPESAQTNLGTKNQTEQELSGIEREITVQQQNRIFLMQQLQTAQAGANGGNLGALEDDYKRRAAVYDESHPDMIALRRQIDNAKRGGSVNSDGSLRAELETKKSILAETRTRYSEDHPDVKRLARDIGVLEKRIAAGERVDPAAATGTSPVVLQLTAQIRAADNQIASLTGRLSELRSKQLDLTRRLSLTPQVEKDYEALNRDVGTARASYQGLLNQRMESDLRTAAIKSGTVDTFMLVQPAGLDENPIRPKRSGIIMMGLIAAVAIAFVSALIAEMLDGMVRGSRDVLMALSVTPLAVIPNIENAATRKRQRRQLVTAASSALIAIPVLYMLVRLIVVKA